MASDPNEETNVSVSLPVGVVAGVSLLALAAGAAYLLVGREDNENGVAPKAKSGKSPMRRMGIRTLITLIENDTTRKVVVAALKALARRA